MGTFNPRCKICGAETFVAFSLPHDKAAGKPIPEALDDCPYFECCNCHFLFSTLHDFHSNEEIYGDEYWETQDPDWHGRVSETLRLIVLGDGYIDLEPWEVRILDYGCGMGCSVATGRNLGFDIFGTDINPPRFGREYFLQDIHGEKFDLVVACEVLEHLTNPIDTLDSIASCLKQGGVFTFQTAYYDPDVCKRDWWYLGPANGHISLYSISALEALAVKTGFTQLQKWNGYHGVQAWRKDS